MRDPLSDAVITFYQGFASLYHSIYRCCSISTALLYYAYTTESELIWLLWYKQLCAVSIHWLTSLLVCQFIHSVRTHTEIRIEHTTAIEVSFFSFSLSDYYLSSARLSQNIKEQRPKNKADEPNCACALSLVHFPRDFCGYLILFSAAKRISSKSNCTPWKKKKRVQSAFGLMCVNECVRSTCALSVPR